MRSEGPQYDSSNAARAAIQLTICVLIAIAFVVAQDQPPRLTAFSAGVPAGLATPAAPSVDLSATATRTPTPQKTSRPTSVSKAPLQNQAVQSVQIDPRVPRAAVLDKNTVALYHFDSQVGNQVPDATGNYTGTLAGTAIITNSALFGAGALWTSGQDGPGYLQVGNLGDLPAGTLEAYVDFLDACAATSDHWSMIAAGNGYGGTQVLRLYVDPWLDFGLLGSDGYWHWVTSGINPCKYLRNGWAPAMPWPYDVWRFHHVAGTWGPRGLEIWVDGVLHGVGDGANGTQLTCNPQMQTGESPYPPNPYYPNCPGPFFSQTPVPYAYTGGLAASVYNTLLIGCDGANVPSGWSGAPPTHCFEGRFDDVRISNVQRVFNVSVDPPSSPTPTQTPVPITGAYTPDSNTLALYHLDYTTQVGTVLTVVNEVGGHNGVLVGNAAVTPGGRFNSAVSLGGSGYVDIYGLGQNPYNGAVEAWVRLSPSPYSSLPVIGSGADLGHNWDSLFLGVRSTCGSGSTLCFGLMDNSGTWHWADSGVDPTSLYCTWHHIAGTWGTRGVEIWLDGVLRNANTGFIGRRVFDSNNDYTLAGCDSFRNCMAGMIDEIRISSVQRTYTLLGLGANPLRSGHLPIWSIQSTFQVFLPFVEVAQCR